MKRLPVLPLLLLTICSSCSRKSAAELFTEAQVQESQKNFALAADRYDEIVARFPTDAKAESSQFLLALLYQNELHDARKALHAYRRFHDLFPHSDRAPTALFLSAFLYNNDLHNYDSAKIVYEEFVRSYPTHELVPSARYELSTIGKDPNELVPHQAASADTSAVNKTEAAK